MTLDPRWSTRPYVHVAFTYDGDPNSTLVPRWHDERHLPLARHAVTR